VQYVGICVGAYEYSFIFPVCGTESIKKPVTLARQNTLPEDGSLRTETCRSLMNF